MTGPAVAETDPIDSLSFDEVGDAVTPVESSVPDHMVLGGPPRPDESPPETPATATDTKPPANPEGASASPALPEGYTKDALGRVHGPDGKIVSKEKLATLTTPTPQPEAAKPQPFQYRAAKETKAVDGFEQHPDGSVRVAPEKVGELRQLLNARDMLGEGSALVDRVKAENVTLRQQVERFKSGSSAEVEQAKTLIDSFSKILQNPDEAKAIEEFFHLRAQHPVLLAKAEAKYWKTRGEAGRPAQPSQKARESAPPQGLPERESAVEATTEHVERIKLDFKYRDLTADDWRQFSERSERTPFAYLRPATAQDVEKYGVTLGEVVFDTDTLLTDVESHAKSVRAGRESAASAAKLAADNARRTTPSVDAPPVAGGGATPAKAASKPFTSKQEVDDWWNSSAL